MTETAPWLWRCRVPGEGIDFLALPGEATKTPPANDPAVEWTIVTWGQEEVTDGGE